MKLDETPVTGTVARHLAALAEATPAPLEFWWDTDQFSATLEELASPKVATA